MLSLALPVDFVWLSRKFCCLNFVNLLDIAIANYNYHQRNSKNLNPATKFIFQVGNWLTLQYLSFANKHYNLYSTTKSNSILPLYYTTILSFSLHSPFDSFPHANSRSVVSEDNSREWYCLVYQPLTAVAEISVGTDLGCTWDTSMHMNVDMVINEVVKSKIEQMLRFPGGPFRPLGWKYHLRPHEMVLVTGEVIGEVLNFTYLQKLYLLTYCKFSLHIRLLIYKRGRRKPHPDA